MSPLLSLALITIDKITDCIRSGDIDETLAKRMVVYMYREIFPRVDGKVVERPDRLADCARTMERALANDLTARLMLPLETDVCAVCPASDLCNHRGEDPVSKAVAARAERLASVN